MPAGFTLKILWDIKSGTSCTLHGGAPPPVVKAHSDTQMSRLWRGTIWKAYDRLLPKWRQRCYELTCENKSSRFPRNRNFFRLHLDRPVMGPLLGTPTSLISRRLVPMRQYHLDNQSITLDILVAGRKLEINVKFLVKSVCRHSTSQLALMVDHVMVSSCGSVFT